MKRLFWIAGFVSAFGLAALAVTAGTVPNFAGTWQLEKTKSQGLSQRFQNADSVACIITQTEKQISIEWKTTGGQSMTGGPGGGAGMGRGAGMAGPQVYNLDGKEVTTENTGQMGGNTTTKATWSSDGQALELLSVRTGSFNGNEFKAAITDKLQLSADSKVLTITRHSESPRGTQDATLVFNKH